MPSDLLPFTSSLPSYVISTLRSLGLGSRPVIPSEDSRVKPSSMSDLEMVLASSFAGLVMSVAVTTCLQYGWSGHCWFGTWFSGKKSSSSSSGHGDGSYTPLNFSFTLPSRSKNAHKTPPRKAYPKYALGSASDYPSEAPDSPPTILSLPSPQARHPIPLLIATCAPVRPPTP